MKSSRRKLTKEQLAAIRSAPEQISSADLAHQFGCATITVDKYGSGGWFSPIFVIPCRDCGAPVIAHTKIKVCRECKRKRVNGWGRERYAEQIENIPEWKRERAGERTRRWYVEHRKRAEAPGLTAAQVAARFGVSPEWVLKLVASGQLYVKLRTPRRTFFDPPEVERCVAVRKENAANRYGPNTPGLLSRKQVAARLGLSRTTVDSYIADVTLVLAAKGPLSQI